MKPSEAIQLLDTVASMVNLNRADHIKVASAVELLKKFISDNEPNQKSVKESTVDGQQ